MSPAPTLVEALEPLRSNPARAAVLLDIDGTLAPIVRHAADAHVPEATRTLLIEIAKRYRLVGCVSGRRATTARQIVAIGTIAYVGNHGGELLRPGATTPELDADVAAWSTRIREFAARVDTSELQRLRVRSEDKHVIAAFHWRGAPDEDAAAAAVCTIAERAQAEGLVVHWGRKVLEVRPPVALDKGIGISTLLRSAVGGADDGSGSGDGDSGGGSSSSGGSGGKDDSSGSGGGKDDSSGGTVEPVLDAAVYVGDDTTDLDAFHGLRVLVEEHALLTSVCVAVRSDETPPELALQADLVIDGPSGVRQLLEALLQPHSPA
ncbi:MAG TPA: trehalose-phosphatase [Solirubrobacteraceae bacterium]|nr:trehalose-phosphatase [Solirubrobacteraceae bacterium]